MKHTLHIKPHRDPLGDRQGVQVCEVKDERGRVVAVLYPTDDGCKLVSRHFKPLGATVDQKVPGIYEVSFTLEHQEG